MKSNNNLSNLCFFASLASVAVSIATWVSVGEADPAHAERFGIFIGLWAPTLMGLANYYKEQILLTVNFLEFCKVLSIVFGTSFMIFSIKKVVVGFDWENNADAKKSEPSPESTEVAEVISLQTDVDFIDYDGMGNQGRFPKKKANFK